jgi:thymidylate kinase
MVMVVLPREQALRIAGSRALAEAERAINKHPKFNSTHEGYAVIAEELDELWDDVKANRTPESVQEAVQVAAMAIRYIAEFG